MSPAAPASKQDRIIDRVLSLPALDAAYRVASMDKSLEVRSSLLTVALREYTTEQEAGNKTKKTLSRVWLNPPPDAAPMINWAIKNPQEFSDHRLLHVGALIATYPYIGGIAGMIGRQLALDETVSVSELRRRAEGRWGATSTVQQGVGKVVTTLRRMAVLDGGGRSAITTASPLQPSPLASTWLIHAIMLTRQVHAIDASEALTAPELFWVEGLVPSVKYPFLENHAEGPNRRVWAVL